MKKKKKDIIDTHVEGVIQRNPNIQAMLVDHLNWIATLSHDELKDAQDAAAKRFRVRP